MENHASVTYSATEAKNRFGALLREAARTDRPIVIERDGRAVAVLLSIRAYGEQCRPVSPATGDRAELARAAFGMWAEREDLEEDWLEHGRQHWQSEWPSG